MTSITTRRRRRATTTTATPGATAPHAATAAAVTDGVRVYGTGPTAVRALDGVTLRFARSRFTAVMGPSGSGKSTLLHALAGLDRVDEGTVTIGGTDLSTLSDTQLTRLRRDRVGFVFQSFNLVPTLTARDNITLPLAIAGRRVDDEWLDTIATTMSLVERLDHRPTELSGGQQQRVAVARAMVTRPDIVFADEPSGNLDSTSGARLLGFLRRAVREFDQTVVMVTHDPVAASHADRVVFLADGRFAGELADPTPEAVAAHFTTLGG